MASGGRLWAAGVGVDFLSLKVSFGLLGVNFEYLEVEIVSLLVNFGLLGVDFCFWELILALEGLIFELRVDFKPLRVDFLPLGVDFYASGIQF